MRLKLNGYVAADEDKPIYEHFGIPAFCPADVRQALSQLPDGETLTLEINSYGGSVWAGSEIYSVLRTAGAVTTAEIESLAASAASYLALGCDAVYISPVAQMMIHPPSTLTEGDTAEHQQSIKLLEAITESILNAYVAKSKGRRSREELAQMMQSTSWLTAQDALDAGLVDGILYQEEDGEFSPGAIVNAASSGLMAITGGLRPPDLAQLRAEYQKAKNQPVQKDPAASDNWKEQARLELEKNRFM